MVLSGAEKFSKICSENSNLWMGIVNLTPDSFSDGGEYFSIDKAMSRIDTLVKNGAHILDFGGASSRPNSPLITPEEEFERVYQVILKARKRIPEDVLISLDTYSPRVAQKLAEEGLIDIVNDIFSGLRAEITNGIVRNTAEITAEYKLGYILMHMQGVPENMQINPSYGNCLSEVRDFLRERILFAEKCGVKSIAIDPGIGFGKSLENNIELLSQSGIEFLKELDKPILIGLSRKSFLGKIYPNLTEPSMRDRASKEFESKCLQFGAKIIRSHIMASELNFN